MVLEEDAAGEERDEGREDGEQRERDPRYDKSADRRSARARACGDSCAGSPIRVGGLVAGVVVVPVAGGEQQMLERLLEHVHGGEHEEDDLREERDGLHTRVPAPKPYP